MVVEKDPFFFLLVSYHRLPQQLRRVDCLLFSMQTVWKYLHCLTLEFESDVLLRLCINGKMIRFSLDSAELA